MGFLSEALKSPGKIGAIAPSSARLSRAIVAAADIRHAPRVVELGPGTGPITAQIVTALAPKARFIAVEINASFAARLRVTFPRAEVVEGSAADLGTILRDKGLDQADRILCGLPWTAFPASLQTDILDAVVGSLTPEGVFVTFAYAPLNHLPRGAHFYGLLKARFARVEKSALVLNLPPAFCYVCRGPVSGLGH